MNIVVVGASTAQGYWDMEGGWAERVKREFMQRAIKSKNYYAVPSVFNISIDGDDAIKILKRLNTELCTRIGNKNDDVIIFQFGVNDSSRQQGEFIETPTEFKKNYEEIIKIAKNYANNVVLCNILPCNDELVQPVAWNDAIYYYNDRIVEFNAKIKELCSENNLKMIDIFSVFAGADAQGLLEDGLHPNSFGHELIYNAVMEEME